MDERSKRSQKGTVSAGAHRAGLTQDHRVSDIIREVMSPCPRALNPDATVLEAAEVMRRDDIGDVLVMADADRALVGILTDRDIVVRALAEGRDPAQTRVGDVCSRQVVTVGPEDSVGHAVRVMREKAIRRIPVVTAASCGDTHTRRHRSRARFTHCPGRRLCGAPQYMSGRRIGGSTRRESSTR